MLKHPKQEFAALLDALSNNQVEKAKQLVKQVPGLDLATDDTCRTAFHYAASYGCLPFMQFIINGDDSFLSREGEWMAVMEDDCGWNPLMIASSAGHPEVVRYLLSISVTDVNSRNKNGQTALHYACSKNHPEVVKLLIKNGADVNAADRYGATPLHRAAAQDREQVTRLLLADSRIQMNKADRSGNTALHCACEDSCENVAVLLMQSGADRSIQNKEEKTPLDLVPTYEMRRKLQACL